MLYATLSYPSSTPGDLLTDMDVDIDIDTIANMDTVALRFAHRSGEVLNGGGLRSHLCFDHALHKFHHTVWLEFYRKRDPA